MTNPNPMNARCGLEVCDCEYTIGGLLRRLEIVAEQLAAVAGTCRSVVAVTRDRSPCEDSDCLCYQAGYEAERRPMGA